MKTALIICPSYDLAANNDERAMQTFLVKARLMPKPLQYVDGEGQLKGYSWEKDVVRIRQILQQNGFKDDKITVLSGIVDEVAFVNSMEKLIQDATVAALFFCGHGTASELSHEHGSMVLSHNQRFTSAAMARLLQGFDGTFIHILNMCSAHGIAPSASNAPTSNVGRAGMDAAKHAAMPHRGSYNSSLSKIVRVYAADAFEETVGTSNGSPLIRVLGEVFATDQTVTYQNFAALFAKHQDSTPLNMKYEGNFYTGIFFNVAVPNDLVSFDEVVISMYD